MNFLKTGTNIHRVHVLLLDVTSFYHYFRDVMMGWTWAVVSAGCCAHCYSDRFLRLNSVCADYCRIDYCQNHVLSHYCPIKEIMYLIVLVFVYVFASFFYTWMADFFLQQCCILFAAHFYQNHLSTIRCIS